MRRLLLSSLSAVLVVGCAGHEPVGPPTDPTPVLGDQVLVRVGEPAPTTVAGTWRDAVDDAIARLVPALGSAGTALGSPLRALRDAAGAKPDAKLIAATRQQFEAIAPKLPIDLAPDADAIRITLDALGAGK